MIRKLLLEGTIPPAAVYSLCGKSYSPVPIPADIQFLCSALAFRHPPTRRTARRRSKVMKPIKFGSTAVLLLVLGAGALTYAQQPEQPDENKEQRQRDRQSRQQQPEQNKQRDQGREQRTQQDRNKAARSRPAVWFPCTCPSLVVHELFSQDFSHTSSVTRVSHSAFTQWVNTISCWPGSEPRQSSTSRM
jgi:hypothetical protein